MQRKILVAGGALILLLVHLVAVFALGVYVGRYGLSRDGLTLQRPRQAQQQPGAPPQGADPASPLPGQPTVVGRIRYLSSNRVEVITVDGPRQLIANAQTRLRNQSGEQLPREALQEGQLVAVFGQTINNGQQLRADLIIILPNQGATPPNQPEGNAQP